MGRNTKIFLGGVALLFVAFSLFLPKSENREKGYIPPANVFEIDDFEMLTGKDGGNYRLLAAKASFNRVENITELTDLTVEYEDEGGQIIANADKGFYLENRYLVAEGNINGLTDELSFETGEEGIMNYDFKEYLGTVENDVICRQGENTIKADKAKIDFKTKITEFTGNVSINYSM